VKARVKGRVFGEESEGKGIVFCEERVS